MSSFPFMDRIRSFLGLRQEPPRNDFRNPIWGDDDDDGDELYERQANINIYTDPLEVTRQMLDVFKSLSSMFGDNMTGFPDEHFKHFGAIPEITPDSDSNQFESGNIRDYYLKPGYQHKQLQQLKEDADLDGQISSNDISGLLDQKEDNHGMFPANPYDGNVVPGRSFCKTIITTSITKPDGTVETKRIIKNGNEVTETTTTTRPGSDPRNPPNPGLVSPSDMFYQNIISEFSSQWRNFH